MRKIISVFALCLLLLSSFAVASAEDAEGEVVDETSATVLDDISSDIAVYSVLDPVTAEDTTGFKSVILGLIGDYEGIVTEYQYTNSNGTISTTREITPDYPWLCACAIFLVAMYCCFRLGAAILCKK